MPARCWICCRVLVEPDEGIAHKSGGNQLANAVGALLIGNVDAQAIGLDLEFLRENKLIEHLLRVKRLQGGRDGARVWIRVSCVRTSVTVTWSFPTLATTSAVGVLAVPCPGIR